MLWWPQGPGSAAEEELNKEWEEDWELDKEWQFSSPDSRDGGVSNEHTLNVKSFAVHY